MKTIAQIATATALAVGMLSIAAPAFATDTSHALKLCRQNNRCHSRVGEHSIIFTIDGNEVVECPKLSTGECIIVRISPLFPRNVEAMLKNGNLQPLVTDESKPTPNPNGGEIGGMGGMAEDQP
jgi:hypothetical protein